MSDALAALRRSVVFGFVALIGAVGSGHAWAACTQSDLTGRYQVYVNWTDPDGGGWTYCRIRVDSSGAVAAGTKFVERNESGTQSAETVKGGNLTATRSCRVKGRIDKTGCSNVFSNDWLTLSNAFFSKDKDTIVGVGKDCTGAPLQFTILRR